MKKLPFVNLSIAAIRKGNLLGQNWYKRVRSWTGNTFLDNSGDRGLDDPGEDEESRYNNTRTFIAWENGRHFATPPTVPPPKWRLRDERRNSILMTRHYPDLGSVSEWSQGVGSLLQPIRSTTQIWVMTRHQYGISALVSQTSFRGETVGCVAKRRLFSQARIFKIIISKEGRLWS